jgi:hypothetical protein
VSRLALPMPPTSTGIRSRGRPCRGSNAGSRRPPERGETRDEAAWDTGRGDDVPPRWCRGRIAKTPQHRRR